MTPRAGVRGGGAADPLLSHASTGLIPVVPWILLPVWLLFLIGYSRATDRPLVLLLLPLFAFAALHSSRVYRDLRTVRAGESCLHVSHGKHWVEVPYHQIRIVQVSSRDFTAKVHLDSHGELGQSFRFLPRGGFLQRMVLSGVPIDELRARVHRARTRAATPRNPPGAGTAGSTRPDPAQAPRP